MLTVNDRLAELWTIQKGRTLTKVEQEEMVICLDANANYARKMSELENLSYIAYSTNDFEWLHKICADIDELEAKHVRKRKIG